MTSSMASTTPPDVRLLAPVARLAGVHAAGVLGGMLGLPVQLMEWTADIAPSWTPGGDSIPPSSNPDWRRRSAAIGGDLIGELGVAIAPESADEVAAALLRELPQAARAQPGLADSALDELAQILAGAFATVLSGTLQLDVNISVIGILKTEPRHPVRLGALLAVRGHPACWLKLETDQATLRHVASLLEEL